MTHDELKAALRVFGLGERASVQEIKTRYRELAKQHHPDGGQTDDGEPGGIFEVKIPHGESDTPGFVSDSASQRCPQACHCPGNAIHSSMTSTKHPFVSSFNIAAVSHDSADGG